MLWRAPSAYRSSTDVAPSALTRPPMVTGESAVTGAVKGMVTSIGRASIWLAEVHTAPRATPEVTISVCPDHVDSFIGRSDEVTVGPAPTRGRPDAAVSVSGQRV